MTTLRKSTYFAAAAALGLAIGTLTRPASAGEAFNYAQMRLDFFAGFQGDNAAMTRALANSEAELARNPSNAEALVWHGSGLFFQSGQLMVKGDTAKGMELYKKGLDEMDRAVKMAPENIGVRIPRGAPVLAAARAMNPSSPASAGLLERARSDYEFAYSQQHGHLGRMSEHTKGELLFGLADIYSRVGEETKAAEFFGLVQTHLAGTEYGRRAVLWNETRRPLPMERTTCVGCHTTHKESN